MRPIRNINSFHVVLDGALATASHLNHWMDIAAVPGKKGKYTYFLKITDAQKQWRHYIPTVAGDNDFMKPFFNSIKLT